MTASTSDVLLATSAVSKSYGGRRVLHEVSLEFAAGEIHALVGGNGSGKSTLIKVLAGVEPGDAGGTISNRQGSHPTERYGVAQAKEGEVRVVHQDLALFDDLSVAENLALGHGYPTARATIRWGDVRRRAAAVLKRYGIAARPDAPLRSLRPVERTMVAIGRVMQDAEQLTNAVLILDEPTASLPQSESRDLYAHLRAAADQGHSVWVVTHRLDEVLQHTDRITILRDGHVIGTYRTSTLDEPALVELMLGKPVEQIFVNHVRPVGHAEALTVRGLFSGPVRGLDLRVEAGEVVGIAGLRGSGRTTLLRTIFGDLPAESGSVSVSARTMPRAYSPKTAMSAGIAFVPENRRADAAFPDLTVRENLSAADVPLYWEGMRLRLRRERVDSGQLVERFLIRTHSAEQPLEELSGGNQQKVIMARWLRRNPRLLLLDEPSQGVDVGARAEIYGLLRKATAAGAGALVVTSDLEELAHVCDRVLVLRGGRIVGETRAPDISVQRLTEMTYETGTIDE